MQHPYATFFCGAVAGCIAFFGLRGILEAGSHRQGSFCFRTILASYSENEDSCGHIPKLELKVRSDPGIPKITITVLYRVLKAVLDLPLSHTDDVDDSVVLVQYDLSQDVALFYSYHI